jgi:hypothetical protein
MRRIGSRLGVALITFCLGVGLTWVALLNSQSAIVEIGSLPLSETTLERPPAAPTEPAMIAFMRSYKIRYGVILAEFKVTNVSSKPLGYAGDYSNRNWNRYYYVRRGNELQEPDRTCGTGLADYTLLPGKSVTFEVVAGDEPGRVQIGFEFYVGENHFRQTIWSDEVYVSATALSNNGMY